jgi:hypothetical protein
MRLDRRINDLRRSRSFKGGKSCPVPDTPEALCPETRDDAGSGHPSGGLVEKANDFRDQERGVNIEMTESLRR